LMWIYRHTHIDSSLSLYFLIPYVIFLSNPHLLNRNALFIIFSITIKKKKLYKKNMQIALSSGRTLCWLICKSIVLKLICTCSKNNVVDVTFCRFKFLCLRFRLNFSMVEFMGSNLYVCVCL
jgi:hypothetical protein